MHCADLVDLLEDRVRGRLSTSQQQPLNAHLSRCADCRHAWNALQVLHAERAKPVPKPHAKFVEQTLGLAAAQSPLQPDARSGRFWLGAALGSALAASIVLAVLGTGPALDRPAVDSTPELVIALHETRDVSIGIDSPVHIETAEIRVVLAGAASLAGFEGRSEMSWTTPLDRGLNMLTLPVNMHGPGGGHVLVEVGYGAQRKTFAVSLRDRGDFRADPTRG